MAKQPRSWWPAEGETRLSKRHDEVPLGGKQVLGPYERNPAASKGCLCRCRDQAGAEPVPLGAKAMDGANLEVLVLDYAVAISRTPVEVSDACSPICANISVRTAGGARAW